MPAATGKSLLMSKLGARITTAHQKHKGDETNLGQVELPEGIEGGIAKLSEVKFDLIKEGKEGAGNLYFYAAGIVLLPKEHKGVPVEGMRTSITEVLYDTPSKTRKTVEDHWAWILNELRKLGVNTAQISESQVESVCATLKQQQPTFRFRTWKGSKQTTGEFKDREPRVQHQWNGLVDFHEDDPGGGDNGGVVDKTPPANTQANGTGSGSQFNEFGDLGSLVTLAAGDDEKAQDKLTELAVAKGYTKEQVVATDGWDQVRQMIEGNGPAASTSPPSANGTGAATTTPSEPGVPEPGDLFDVKVPKPGDAKRKIKVEIEVKSVDKAKKTVTGISQVDKKTEYKDIPWDQLIGG